MANRRQAVPRVPSQLCKVIIGAGLDVTLGWISLAGDRTVITRFGRLMLSPPSEYCLRSRARPSDKSDKVIPRFEDDDC